MPMTTQNWGTQLRKKVIDELGSTDAASVSDPSRPEYDKSHPNYDPRLDSSSPHYGEGSVLTPYTGGHQQRMDVLNYDVPRQTGSDTPGPDSSGDVSHGEQVTPRVGVSVQHSPSHSQVRLKRFPEVS